MYKRQVSNRRGNPLPYASVTVSYTHLDVYKRQQKYGSISSCNYDSKWKFSFVSVIKTINIQFNNQAEPDRHYCSCLRNDDKVCKLSLIHI